MSIVVSVMRFLDRLLTPAINGIKNKYKDTIIIEKDIPYSQGDERCKLNIHYLKDYDASKKRPVAIYFHGGAFVAGNKNPRSRFCNFIANQGFFVINVAYSLSPEKKFHEYIYEFSNLLNWISKNADKYNIATDDMLVSGDSAGGHCASVLSCLVTNSEYRKVFNIQVPKNINITHALFICGCFNVMESFTKKYPARGNFVVAKSLTGLDFKKKTMDHLSTYKYYKQLCTLDYITPDFPKSFVLHTLKDTFCYNQGFQIIDVLEKQSVPYQEYCDEKEIHCFILLEHRKSSKKALPHVQEFLRTNYSKYS